MRPSNLPVLRSLAAFIGFFLFGTALYGAKPTWKAVAPEELAESEPKLGASAPAEAIFLDVQVDDRGYPYKRTTTKYARYKVYDPEKADSVTRLSNIQIDVLGGGTEIYARLLTPDGRVEEFGKEAIKERPLVKSAQQAGFMGWLAGSQSLLKEQFLAIPGVERGSIVEFFTRQEDRYPSAVQTITGQMKDVPVRSFEYRAQLYEDHQFFNRTFYTNSMGAKLVEDQKARKVSLSVKNLPAWQEEPFSGPRTEQILTIYNCYESSSLMLLPRSGRVPVPNEVKAKSGPWAPYATIAEWAAMDRSYSTKRLKQLALEITQTAKDDTDKARLIHRWVRQEYQSFRVENTTGTRFRVPGSGNDTRMDSPRSIDDIIDWQKDKNTIVNSMDFLWLAFGLCREAGLTPRIVMLPDREVAGFNEQAVSQVFLPEQAIALKVGEKWLFSAPHARYGLPFNMLSWKNEGQPGLLAIAHKQEFIQVPVSEADRSLMGTGGTLVLDEKGTLAGNFMRRLTGHAAVLVRGQLRDVAPAGRNERAKRLLNLDIEGAEIKVLSITGLDDPDAPLDIACSLRCEGYAVKTKDRLILRPLVFRLESTTPFPAEQRKRSIYFPRRWQELDQVTLTWPEGYELEGANRPQMVSNEVLHYKVDISVEREQRRLHLRRTFFSGIIALPVDKYEPIRAFYDHVTRGDQLEVVLSKAKKEGQ